MTDQSSIIYMQDRVMEVIERKMPEKENLLVAIDGRCAAGKTTVASYLEKELSCNCIHMDHFFLQPIQRTPKRLEEPGGNVDYERFLEEVLLPLRRGKEFTYRPFDCKTMDFTEPVRVVPGSVTIIEGSYACHPELIKYYDLRIFLSVDPIEQLKRIEKRNGSEALKIFSQKWIPLEEKYIQAFHIPEQCDLTF